MENCIFLVCLKYERIEPSRMDLVQPKIKEKEMRNNEAYFLAHSGSLDCNI